MQLYLDQLLRGLPLWSYYVNNVYTRTCNTSTNNINMSAHDSESSASEGQRTSLHPPPPPHPSLALYNYTGPLHSTSAHFSYYPAIIDNGRHLPVKAEINIVYWHTINRLFNLWRAAAADREINYTHYISSAAAATPRAGGCPGTASTLLPGTVLQ